jgi:hypothetical protein
VLADAAHWTRRSGVLDSWFLIAGYAMLPSVGDADRELRRAQPGHSRFGRHQRPSTSIGRRKRRRACVSRPSRHVTGYSRSITRRSALRGGYSARSRVPYEVYPTYFCTNPALTAHLVGRTGSCQPKAIVTGAFPFARRVILLPQHTVESAGGRRADAAPHDHRWSDPVDAGLPRMKRCGDLRSAPIW